MDNNALDKFGELIVANCIDNGLDKFQNLTEGKINAPSLKKLQDQIKLLNNNNIEIIKNLLSEILVSTTHDFLFAIQENDDIQIIVDNQNICKSSDGLHGELFTEEGWIKKFSNHTDFIDYD
ncbi:hypothetical protein MBM09_07585 [Flaviramulus sp. BrNp1-15]|uniref:hypothetical protein n=1 Tax=Flaviramulus sp. BrNp1-15 TaxID=2916754 RepID=UPI001EE8E1E8|nr:hypothetical protein [Flaviramulus sp. BrNp1-15]ULC60852.1 hypothetical protein MBM09_07585 [Flaviramulus sp. BrNp1-15]